VKEPDHGSETRWPTKQPILGLSRCGRTPLNERVSLLPVGGRIQDTREVSFAARPHGEAMLTTNTPAMPVGDEQHRIGAPAQLSCGVRSLLAGDSPSLDSRRPIVGGGCRLLAALELGALEEWPQYRTTVKRAEGSCGRLKACSILLI
jgi:hypothetical protein